MDVNVICQYITCTKILTEDEIESARTNQFCANHGTMMRALNTSYKEASKKVAPAEVRRYLADNETKKRAALKDIIEYTRTECDDRERYMNLLRGADGSHRNRMKKKRGELQKLTNKLNNHGACGVCGKRVSTSLDARQRIYKFPTHCGSNTCHLKEEHFTSKNQWVDHLKRHHGEWCDICQEQILQCNYYRHLNYHEYFPLSL